MFSRCNCVTGLLVPYLPSLIKLEFVFLVEAALFSLPTFPLPALPVICGLFGENSSRVHGRSFTKFTDFANVFVFLGPWPTFRSKQSTQVSTINVESDATIKRQARAEPSVWPMLPKTRWSGEILPYKWTVSCWEGKQVIGDSIIIWKTVNNMIVSHNTFLY